MLNGSFLRLVILLCLTMVVVAAGADFYKILGIKKSASPQEIKKAYRKLAKLYHPDKTSDQDAAQKFLDVGHAFEVLSDKEKKATYDKYGEEGLKQGGGGGFHDPFDVFRNAFGGGFGGGQQQQRKGNNMIAEIEVDLSQLYKGDSVSFTIAVQQICLECSGSGARSDADIVSCTTCGGNGIRTVRHQLAPGMFQQVNIHCDACGGRGKITKHLCSTCHGHRVVQGTSTLDLHVDRGLPEGAEVVFPGEADESPDFEPGDVVMRVRSKRTPGGFVRKESNLYWKETLSVSEALLGFKKTVKSLDGHDIILQRTAVTQPGYVQVIKDEGLPIYHDSGHGDLFVEYSVVLPGTVSPQLHASLSTAFGYRAPSSLHSEL